MLTGFVLLVAVVCTGCATALTGSPNHVSDDGVNMFGKVVTDTAGEVEFWVEYGPTTAYGSQTPPETQTFEANSPTSVTVSFSGLQRSTLYHYRFCAQDDTQQGGPSCGEDRTFRTQSFACGETVTTDVRLTDDYLCNNEPGLVVGAAGIDVNLAGHRFTGDSGLLPNGPIGIDNRGGFDDVTVRNGGLPGWGDAVYMRDASRNRVLDVDALGKISAITVRGGDHNEIRRSELAGGSWGLLATDSTNLVVAANEASASEGSGVFVFNGDSARIVRNRVENFTGPDVSQSGISLTDSAGGRIAENKVIGKWSFGGIFVDGGNHVVVDNAVTGGALQSGSSAPANGDGLFVFRVLEGPIVLRRNDARLNEGDGIQVWSGGAQLADNIAVDNGDIGIDAAAGTIDLGGNFAVGNDGPAQCVNVFCQ